MLSKLMQFFQKPGVRYTIFVLLFLLIFWGIFRSCSEGKEELQANFYRVARDASWYPFDLQGKEQNMVGFTNDLFAKISELQNVQIEVFDVSSKSLFFGLDHSNWEGVLSSLRKDVYNQSKYDFSEPFYSGGLVLVVRMDSSLKSFSEIQGKVIGFSKDLSLSSGITQYDSILTPYGRTSAAIDDLVSNRLDAVVIEFATARLYTQGVYSGKIKIATPPVVDETLKLVTLKSPGGDKFVNLFNEGMKKLVKDGTFEKLITKWSLFSP